MNWIRQENGPRYVMIEVIQLVTFLRIEFNGGITSGKYLGST